MTTNTNLRLAIILHGVVCLLSCSTCVCGADGVADRLAVWFQDRPPASDPLYAACLAVEAAGRPASLPDIAGLRPAWQESEHDSLVDPAVRPVSFRQRQGGSGSGGSSAAGGSGAAGGGGSLSQQSQNPVANLASFPLQSNFAFGIGPEKRMQYVGNFQPVVPLRLTEKWNLIARLIVPFVNNPIGLDARSDGLGDSIGQFFFSPRDAEGFIWGVGPTVLFPTASDPTLGNGEWGVGISGVGLISHGKIVAGVLTSQIWGTEGTTKPFLVQPFFNYNFERGWFVSASGEANADWELPEPSRWTFPFGPGVGRTFVLLGQPIQVATRFGSYLAAPPGGPDWQFRAQVTLLFPK